MSRGWLPCGIVSLMALVGCADDGAGSTVAVDLAAGSAPVAATAFEASPSTSAPAPVPPASSAPVPTASPPSAPPSSTSTATTVPDLGDVTIEQTMAQLAEAQLCANARAVDADESLEYGVDPPLAAASCDGPNGLKVLVERYASDERLEGARQALVWLLLSYEMDPSHGRWLQLSDSQILFADSDASDGTAYESMIDFLEEARVALGGEIVSMAEMAERIAAEMPDQVPCAPGNPPATAPAGATGATIDPIPPSSVSASSCVRGTVPPTTMPH